MVCSVVRGDSVASGPSVRGVFDYPLTLELYIFSQLSMVVDHVQQVVPGFRMWSPNVLYSLFLP